MPIRSKIVTHYPGENIDTVAQNTSNPYVAKIKEKTEDDRVFFGPELPLKKGNWGKYFSESLGFYPESIILDIGCYKGKTVLDLARTFPRSAVVGMDITYKRIYLSSQKAREQGVKNVAWIFANAQALTEIFAVDELSGICLLFPDPWSKKRKQVKNRLISETFVASMGRCLKNQGFFWLKTDGVDYFQWTLKHLEHSPFTPGPSPWTEVNTGVFTTLFENLFRGKNLPIYEKFWYNQKGVIGAQD